MDGALDARTWLTIVVVVVGFFLVPFAMLVYDHRQQQHARHPPPDQPDAAVPGERHARRNREGARRQEGHQ